jgi:hypothetical protein
MTPEGLRAILPGVREQAWLSDAEARVRADPGALPGLFARAGRALGRQELPGHPGWSPGQAGRVLLLIAGTHETAAKEAEEKWQELYWQGDSAEKLAVLHALPLLPVGDAGVPLLQDALRTNDPRLVAAALGPYAARLDAETWRQGVVKCVFMGVPLRAVHGLAGRADAGLRQMLAALAKERAAAGRRMPADAAALIDEEA